MAFLMVWFMIGVIVVWLMSARPMLQRVGHFVAPSLIPAMEADASEEQSGELVQETSGQDLVFPIVITPEPTPTPAGPVAPAAADQVVIVQPTIQPTIQPNQQTAQDIQTDYTSPMGSSAAEFSPFAEVYGVDIYYTHYWPLEGGINCWDWNEATQWCDSPTFSGIPWETAVGWGAACPYDWPIGTWIEVPYYGAVQCIDRGSMTCQYHEDGTATCHVDILAQTIGDIDGQVLYSKVFINW